MRTIQFRSAILLATFLVLTASMNAQQKKTPAKVYRYSSSSSSSSDSNTQEESAADNSSKFQMTYAHHQTSIQTKDGKERIVTDRNDTTYQLEFADGKMTFLSVDGIKIPEEKWGEYDALIKEIRAQIERDKEQARLDRIQAGKDREQAMKDRAQAQKDRLQADRDRLQARQDRLQHDKDRAQAERDRQQADQDRMQADKDKEQVVRDRAQADKDREQALKDRAQAEKDREQAVRDRVQAEKDREQAARDRVQAEKDRAQAAADKKLMAELTADLVRDKLIASESGLRMLTLSSVEMTLNGIKQPDDVHKKYSEKYSRFAKNNLAYMSNGSNKSIQMGSNN